MNDRDLSCAVEGDELVIRVGVATLAQMAEEKFDVSIHRPQLFARKVSDRLLDPYANGISAIRAAIVRTGGNAFFDRTDKGYGNLNTMGRNTPVDRLEID